MEGLSGKIKFDGAGFRSDFQLDIVELKREGLVQVTALAKNILKVTKIFAGRHLGPEQWSQFHP